MKAKYFLFLCIILFFSNKMLLGQNGLTIALNSSYPGNSIYLGFSKRFMSNTLHIGLKYHINKNSFDSPVTNLYKRNYYSSTFINHFGAIFSYDYNVITLCKSFSPFVYYDLHLIHSSLIRPGVTEEIQSDDLFDAVWTFDNYCGIGLKYLLSDQITIFFKGGLGISTCIKPPNELLRKDFETEFASQISFGLSLFINSTRSE